MNKARAKEIAASLDLAIVAVDRCRELLVNADADADDLAEYDAATQGLRFTLAALRPESPEAGGGAWR